ncbi:ATP-binding cassette domain-containing protein [Corallincola holothuriorum]|uniref:ATP-binding cassette domain-containing protein n=1 Tax=Corallincola holothuriorum TaxID=2282215 RepID=UPI001F46555E|nr:ATP-binding cassette domain-containing protein [Corallincola holothuriorum]
MLNQLKLSGATLSYGKQQVIAPVHLEINPGEHVALVGRSGAGKSSLLNMLYQQAAERAALCPQSYGLVAPLSVYHNIYMGQLPRHNALYNLCNLLRPWATRRAEVAELAAELGLSDKLFSAVAELSGGQQQRTAIGRALYQQAPIFLGDEPVSSVDPLQAKLLIELIQSRHQSSVIALHNKQLALSCFDRVIGLDQGKILFDLSGDALTAAQLDALYVDA